MYEHDIRWSALVPLSVIVGLLALYSEIADVWFAFPARPDWFWILAFYTILKAPPVPSMFALAWCGVARDMLLGPKAGGASLAFILAGLLTVYWKPLAGLRGWFALELLVGVSCFFTAVLRHSLDAGAHVFDLLPRTILVALGDGLLTAIAFFPAAMVLSIPWLRPWREQSGHH